jgi:aryl-alcohol dehydrogenase-like predicted oxidoreductase
MSPSAIPLRPCGGSGLELPVIGIGCWSFGGGAYWGPQSQQDVDAVVAEAIDLGAIYFDTAEAYNDGASETALGLALRGRRDRALIGTKVSPDHAYPEALRASCEASLRRLGTDRIDLYMIHWPLNPSALRHFTSDERLIENPPRLPEALATLAALRDEGKIRHIGVSNFGVRQMEELVAAGVPVAANQLAYSLLSRGIELEILPACRRYGMGVVGYMALMQGLLSGKFASLDDIPPSRTRTRHFSGRRPGSRHGGPGVEAETWAALGAIGAIADEIGMSRADLALAWAAARPGISCTLAGCRNVAQLRENVRAVERPLPADVVARLDRATAEVLEKLGPWVDYFQSVENSRTR